MVLFSGRRSSNAEVMAEEDAKTIPQDSLAVLRRSDEHDGIPEAVFFVSCATDLCGAGGGERLASSEE